MIQHLRMMEQDPAIGIRLEAVGLTRSLEILQLESEMVRRLKRNQQQRQSGTVYPSFSFRSYEALTQHL